MRHFIVCCWSRNHKDSIWHAWAPGSYIITSVLWYNIFWVGLSWNFTACMNITIYIGKRMLSLQVLGEGSYHGVLNANILKMDLNSFLLVLRWFKMLFSFLFIKLQMDKKNLVVSFLVLLIIVLHFHWDSNWLSFNFQKQCLLMKMGEKYTD